jgi:hypothetical protein
MGFIRNQQVNLAVKLLAWQYERQSQPVPPFPQLQQQARRLVDEAHRIARQRGGNVLAILKQMVSDMRRR